MLSHTRTGVWFGECDRCLRRQVLSSENRADATVELRDDLEWQQRRWERRGAVAHRPDELAEWWCPECVKSPA